MTTLTQYELEGYTYQASNYIVKPMRYAETFNRKLLLHTEQENIICRKSMKEMEQTLADAVG